MGELSGSRYRALQREAALTIVPDEAAQEKRRLKCFEQEAHVFAGLNDPKLLALLDVGEDFLSDAQPGARAQSCPPPHRLVDGFLVYEPAVIDITTVKVAMIPSDARGDH